MTVSVQDVSVIQKRINFKGGYFEYSRNENGQRVRNDAGQVIFSSVPEDNMNSDFNEVSSALATLSKVVASHNKRLNRTSPLKGRKLGPRKSKDQGLASPVQ